MRPVIDDTAVLDLPDDPVELKRIIAQRDEVIAQRESQIQPDTLSSAGGGVWLI